MISRSGVGKQCDVAVRFCLRNIYAAKNFVEPPAQDIWIMKTIDMMTDVTKIITDLVEKLFNHVINESNE